MQDFFTPAASQATASVRYPAAVVKVSWKRVLNSETLASVGSSLVGGLDIVSGANLSLMPWDSYLYYDETENVLSFSYDRQYQEPYGGIAAALAEAVLDNSDNRYTPNYNATIGTALSPRRPVAFYAGFTIGTKRTLPVFKGVTFDDVNAKFGDKTATLRAADILNLLDQKTLSAAVYLNQRSDQIIESILNDAGLGSSQYILDAGLNTIPFAWFPSSMRALQRIKNICEAEEAVFYQDESGKIRFENRSHYQTFPHRLVQKSLNSDDFLSFERLANTKIINRVIVRASPREVDAANSTLWNSPEEIEVEAGETITIWATPTDPTTSIGLLVYSLVSPVATTDYTAFTATGGGGSNITASQTVVATNFVESVKITLTNGSVSKAYYNLLQLRGKAARVKEAIEEISEDADSINKYGTQEFGINNDFIQTRTWARTAASNILEKYKAPFKKIRITIPALPQLQLKDKLAILDPDLNVTKHYRIVRIIGKFLPGSYIQDIEAREINSAETAS